MQSLYMFILRFKQLSCIFEAGKHTSIFFYPSKVREVKKLDLDDTHLIMLCFYTTIQNHTTKPSFTFIDIYVFKYA